MKILLEYWDKKRETKRTESGMYYQDQSSSLCETQEHEVNSDEDLIALFKEFDKRNNSLRYCNGSYWKFADKKYEVEYRRWYDSLDGNVKFNMFYGNGIVN